MHRLFNLIYNNLYSIKFVYTIYHFFRTTIPNYFDSDRLQKIGYKDLNYFNAIMKENEIEYFCDFGTLLGIVRENSFIKHDIDIDVALIRGKQFDIKKIEQILTNKGLKKTHEYYYCGRVTEESYIFPSGVSIDLFIYDLEDDVMSTYVYYKDHSTVYPDSSFRSVKKFVYPKIDKFKTINFVDNFLYFP